MPTPSHTLRIPDDVWNDAQQKAKEVGGTVTAVVVKALREFAGPASFRGAAESQPPA